jgi:hypothetical protein
MNARIKEITILIIVITFFCTSCKKFVEVPPPKNQLINEAVFADSADATAAVLGLYINMMQSVSLAFANGGMTLYPALSSDELFPTGSNSNEKEFYSNSMTAANSINGGLWTNAYSLIYNANACLEGLASAKTLSQTCKSQLTGEMKVVRALLYFDLVNLYGKVPLVTTTDYHKNEILARTGVEQVYASIISDLTDAQALLKPGYPTSGRLRPNLFTATSLLAKVYLFQGKWDMAEKSASEVINAGLYSLEPDLNNVFLSTSNEAIWKLSPILRGFETWEGYYFVPLSNTIVPRYAICTNLLSAFEISDARKASWLKNSKVNGTEYFYPYKYKLGYDGLSVPKENFVVFRLAEQYLIRAEARARQNNITGALEDLNMIRKRAALSDITATDQNMVLAAVTHERQTELFCEWGNRWLDLKRWGQAGTVLSLIKGANWQDQDLLYPIPQAEISKNPSLTQNAGY